MAISQNETARETRLEVRKTYTALLDKVGVKIDPSKSRTARNALNKEGAVSGNLSDVVAVSAYQMGSALKSSTESLKVVCKIAGAMRLAEVWKHELDDAGKPFKSENAFLKAILPGYASSTVSVYADVGATVYIPRANGELKELAGIEDLGPGTAKFLLSSLKDDKKRAALPAAIKEVKTGDKLSQKAVQAAVKKVNDTVTAPQTTNGNPGQIANELSGGSIDATVKSLIQFAYNGDEPRDGDLTAVVLEKNVSDFMGLLLKASKDSETALAVCDSLYRLAKATK